MGNILLDAWFAFKMILFFFPNPALHHGKHTRILSFDKGFKIRVLSMIESSPCGSFLQLQSTSLCWCAFDLIQYNNSGQSCMACIFDYD
jgi:hypothetical protein